MQYEGENSEPGPLQGTSESPATVAASKVLAAVQSGIDARRPLFPLTAYIDPAEPDAP